MNLVSKSFFSLCFFLAIIFLDSCHKKHFICSAYNSYFIHDQETRESRFSPFIVDSLSGATAYQTSSFDSDTSNNAVSNKAEENESLVSNSKFQPKESIQKKSLKNGLLLASNSKNKSPRTVEEIEMKIIMVKPLSRYSNIDSSSIQRSNEMVESKKDSI